MFGFGQVSVHLGDALGRQVGPTLGPDAVNKAKTSMIIGTLAVAPLSAATASTADPIRDLEYWLNDYGFTQAWNTTRGANVLVSVIDSGIGYAPDINAAVVGGKDFSGIGSPDGRTPVGASPSHGTLVASLLAGRGTGANSGVIGTAPAANLLSASVGFGVSTAVSSDDQIGRAHV